MEAVNGTKRQWVKMKSKGKIVDDPFWYEKGAMKALRNARSRLIPEEIRSKIITLAKTKGRVKDIQHEVREQQQTGQTKDDKITDAQRKKLFAKMKESGLSGDEPKSFYDFVSPKTSKDASDFIEFFAQKLVAWEESQKISKAIMNTFPEPEGAA
jgi:hypothetical protein